MTIDEIRSSITQGRWVSIAPELRPGSTKNSDGSLKPFYLTRDFVCHPDDRFELTVTSLADPFGKFPLAAMYIRGHLYWKGAHPIADGAQKVDFVADEIYNVTPLAQGFADAMNQYTTGYDKWTINHSQSILGKAFPPFGLQPGQVFAECDLIYVFQDLLFWGARHIDGRGFDKEENRPTNLQIPLGRARPRS